MAVARWCGAAAFVGIAAVVLVPLGESGCGGSACQSACENNNKLACAGTCDCTACNTAPSSCNSFFSCVAAQNKCSDIFFNCTEPSECAAYRTKHCK